ncbi:hypothetical protein [Actinoplanes teichomyceticus]|uniref:Tat (Twin-arginine translocation) pathway signal sequence n=1 Tax=Actinoplanes teichomyceticus TaxID=1867 RepID=A0A561VC72_ACTTI|nr:hypothetical protein [Actinoplanes teichomyceticus]TWG09218.1 hypothetical protein FHX34_10917 [Actinoplanes teichomyceticus]GIF17002.1 hypothetical protein Ate01nite_70340 [Actinoplanes teichomyceticus]
MRRSLSTGTRSRLLTVLAGLLAVAFVLAPGPLAAGRQTGDLRFERRLADAVHGSVAEYWRAGGPDLSPGLHRVTDYWFRYHVAKAVIAALLLTALVALGVLVWRAVLRAGGTGAARRGALALGGAAVAVLALFSGALVMANVQGAVAPLSSLMPILVDGPTGARSAALREQIAQRLAGAPDAGGWTPPALQVLVDDFARYHVALAVLAALAAAGLAVLGVRFGRRFARTDRSDRRARHVWASLGAAAALSSLAAVVLVVANTGTAADPAPALAAFLAGGW